MPSGVNKCPKYRTLAHTKTHLFQLARSRNYFKRSSKSSKCLSKLEERTIKSSKYANNKTRKSSTKLVNKSLKGSWRVSQVEWHSEITESPEQCGECRFVQITVTNIYLVMHGERFAACNKSSICGNGYESGTVIAFSL